PATAVEHRRAIFRVRRPARRSLGHLHRHPPRHRIAAVGQAMPGSERLGRAMTLWQAFLWTLRSIFLDKGPFVPAVLGVAFYFVFYPLPYKPETVNSVPVVIADYDESAMSRRLRRDLDATESIQVDGVTRSVEEARPRLLNGEIGGIVVVPRDFSRDVMHGTPTG